jgi:hypothetical protein
MKLKLILAAFFATALSAGQALADCNGAFVNDCQNEVTNNNQQYGGQGGQGGNGYGLGIGIGKGGDAYNRTDVDVRNYNTLGQQQGQHQGQGQGQLQGNIGLGSGNKTSIQIDAPVIPTSTTLKNTPDVSLGGLYPSAPCMGSSNIGGSGPGFSIGFGTSWVDTNCQLMETSRNAPTPADKTYVWCKSEFAKGSPSCPKEAAKSAEAVAPVVVADQADKRKVSGQKEAAPQAVAQSRPTGSTRAWWQADPALVQ